MQKLIFLLPLFLLLSTTGSSKDFYYWFSDARGNSVSKENVFMTQKEAKALGAVLYSEPSTRLNHKVITEANKKFDHVFLVTWSNGFSTSILSLLKDCEALKSLSGVINIRGRVADSIPRWGLTCPHKDLVAVYNFNKRDQFGWTPSNKFEFYYSFRNRFGSTNVVFLEDNRGHLEKSPYKNIISVLKSRVK